MSATIAVNKTFAMVGSFSEDKTTPELRRRFCGASLVNPPPVDTRFIFATLPVRIATRSQPIRPPTKTATAQHRGDGGYLPQLARTSRRPPRHGAADGRAGRPDAATIWPERSGGNNTDFAAEAEARLRPRGPSCRPERSGGQNNGRRAAAPGEGADKMEDGRQLAPRTRPQTGARWSGRERRRPVGGGP